MVGVRHSALGRWLKDGKLYMVVAFPNGNGFDIEAEGPLPDRGVLFVGSVTLIHLQELPPDTWPINALEMWLLNSGWYRPVPAEIHD